LLLGLAAPLAVPLAARAATAGAPDDGLPVAETAQLDYAVYFGAVETIAIETRLALSDVGYQISLRGHTTGMLDWLLDWRMDAETRGSLATGLQPERHLAEVHQHGRLREVALRFAHDGAIDATVAPSPEADDREPVPPALRRGALDPMSAVLLLARTGCGRTVPVFDGRRRYDLEMADGGAVVLQPGEHGPYGGAARLCEFRFKPIAGYQKDGARDAARHYRGWLASALPGFPPVPVRVEAEGWFGFVAIELQRWRRSIP
jgi:hypothetical protein